MSDLTEARMHMHVEQRIHERLNLSHLWRVEDGEAVAADGAAASVWRVVQDAVREAGWKMVMIEDIDILIAKERVNV